MRLFAFQLQIIAFGAFVAMSLFERAKRTTKANYHAHTRLSKWCLTSKKHMLQWTSQQSTLKTFQIYTPPPTCVIKSAGGCLECRTVIGVVKPCGTIEIYNFIVETDWKPSNVQRCRKLLYSTNDKESTLFYNQSMLHYSLIRFNVDYTGELSANGEHRC